MSQSISLRSVERCTTPVPAVSALWTGRVLSGLAVLFLTLDAVVKVLKLGPAVVATAQLGYSEHVIIPLGVIEIVCLIVYLIPRTSVLGAILMTGFLGGATASNVRIGDPQFVVPVALGMLAWGGLFLRDRRLRALIPLRS